MFTRGETNPIKLDGDEYRFMSLEQFNIWKIKGRSIYVVTDRFEDDGNLLGIFWAGQKELPQRTDYTECLDPAFYRHTYAFRLYGAARGQGISHAVLSVCMGDYIGKCVLPAGSWLEVSGLNPPALKMDQKMGYRVVTGLNDQGRLIVVRSFLA